MNISDLLSRRLHNQKLSSPEFKQPAGVVRWLGAVQAQDFNAAKWALALRMAQATDAVIEDAYNKGRILRTHLMRPTWHFVAPEDIRWLLELTAPRVNIKSGPNYRKLELDGALFKRSNKIITKTLQGGKHLTRATLKAALSHAGIASDDPVRLAHILLRAELDGVVCSGPKLGKQFSYALLEERVPKAKMLSRDEALAKLTRRYFTSHGPATLQDFVWWSGLTAADVKQGIESIDRHLRQELVQERVYFGPRATKARVRRSAHLLPAYDEYNVAYKDRQMVLDGSESLTTWDLLGPVVVVDGKAVGTWKRTGEEITLSVSRSLSEVERVAVDGAVERYRRFMGAQAEVTY